MSVRHLRALKPVVAAARCIALGLLATACAHPTSAPSAASSSLTGVASSLVPPAVVASSPSPMSASPPLESRASTISPPPISASGSPREVLLGAKDSGRLVVVPPGAILEVDLTAPAPSAIEPAYSENEAVLHRVASSGSTEGGPTSTARFVALAVGDVRIVGQIRADCGPNVACQAAGGYFFSVSVTSNAPPLNLAGSARQAPPQPPVLCTWKGTPTPDGHLIVTAATASVTIGFTSSAVSRQTQTADLRVVSTAGKLVYDYAAAHAGSPISTAATQPTTLTLAWQGRGQLPAGDYEVSVPVMVDGQIFATCNAVWRVRP